ncbi:glutamate 5-kinase [bacterium]|nr:glutamate 5-kinase [bacterium]
MTQNSAHKLRAVIKVGTSSITHADGTINDNMVVALCQQIVELKNSGVEVLLVTSGAVAAGVAAMGLSERPSDVSTLQALAAIGQSRLMQRYNDEFGLHGAIGAQVLLVPHDFADRQQYLHARQTMLRLLELGVVPIVNENDAIANDEIRFGDNDRIAALVAHSVGADVLVLLTDQDGLFTSDPRHNNDAQLIAEVQSSSDLLAISAGSAGTARGSGGMASKLSAARIASWSGIRTVIARATKKNVVLDAVQSRPGVGTTFVGRDRQLSARKLWIAFAAEATGAVVIDSGATDALVNRGTSLLAVGVVSFTGQFEHGEVIEVLGEKGELIARGASAISSVELSNAKGKWTDHSPLVVHRDELVLLMGDF